MSFANFRKTVHVANYLKELEANLVFAQLCTREYEGEVTQAGQSITFTQLGDVSINDIAKKTGLVKASEVEEIADTALVMVVNQLKDYHFGVGDIDKEEAKDGSGIIGRLRRKSAKNMAVVIDKYIAELAKAKEAQKIYTTAKAITKSNILEELDNTVELLKVADINPNEVSLVLSPRLTKYLKQAYVDLDTSNSKMIKTGYVGTYSGLTIIESNHLYTEGNVIHAILTVDGALGYVNPINHVEAYRPEGGYYDAVKGYSLFDAKIVNPKLFYVWNVTA